MRIEIIEIHIENGKTFHSYSHGWWNENRLSQFYITERSYKRMSELEQFK